MKKNHKKTNYAIISILSLVTSAFGFYLGYTRNVDTSTTSIILIGISIFFFVCYFSQRNS